MIRFFAYHPTAANLLMLVLLVVGIFAMPGLKKETFPEFELPYLSATVVYPGASVSEVEENLCTRLEDAVDALSGINDVYCMASEGLATLWLALTHQADINRMLLDVQTQIGSIRDFPAEIESPIVQELNWNEPVVDIAVSAAMPRTELKAYVEKLKRTMQHDYDVGLVTVTGFSEHQYQVKLKQSAMRQLGLDISAIAGIIHQQNINLPSGNLQTIDKNLLIRFNGRRLTPEQLGHIVIASNKDGALIHLNDIAVIEDRFAKEEEQIIFDNQPAAILKISKTKEEDALQVKARVAQFVADQKADLPHGVKLEMSNDVSSLLWDRLTMMITNGAEGIILVFATMWLFFSFRYSFWIAAGLPVAFLASLALMTQFGLTINIMSLVGLLIAIGIMMDDAIVIAESIAAHIDRGEEVYDAVVKGVQKVLPGVIASFLTTICIFAGLLFLEGEIGTILKAVPQVLILVLIVSLVEAFLILPNHLAHSLHKGQKEQVTSRFKLAFLRRFERFRNDTLVKMVTKVVHYRYAFLGGVLALLTLSFSFLSSGLVSFIPFPELEGDIAEARVILPPGSSLQQTEAVVDRIVDAAQVVQQELSKREQGGPLILHMTKHFNHNSDAGIGELGPHIATVRLDLKSAEQRQTNMHELIDAWREKVGPLAAPLSLVFKQAEMKPGGRDIEIWIQHDDLSILKSASIEIQAYLSRLYGVEGVMDDTRRGKEEIVLKMRQGVESYGVNATMVASQLRAAFYGETADEIQHNGENISIEVKLDSAHQSDLASIENFPIILSNEQQIPLSALVTFSSERHYVRLLRINGLRAIKVYADVDANKASSQAIMRQFKQKEVPKLQKKYPQLRFEEQGQAKDSEKTSRSMGIGFILGLLGIFVILSYQFESYAEPLIVMTAIPLALIGVITGHGLLGYAMSMPSILGFVSLAGIVVNDSILLVQYIRHHIDEGEGVQEAVILASRERFRAVFITSVTTAAGLLPLLLETSLQAQVLKPLVVAIVFGIFTSTALVLFMIPAAYAIFADLGWIRKQAV